MDAARVGACWVAVCMNAVLDAVPWGWVIRFVLGPAGDGRWVWTGGRWAWTIRIRAWTIRCSLAWTIRRSSVANDPPLATRRSSHDSVFLSRRLTRSGIDTSRDQLGLAITTGQPGFITTHTTNYTDGLGSPSRPVPLITHQLEPPPRLGLTALYPVSTRPSYNSNPNPCPNSNPPRPEPQFHWQNYDDKSYLQALTHLRELQAEGLITTIGLCNFDTIRTDEICTYLGPGAIVSNQVQFSLIDTRPLDGMADVCQKHNVKLLTYGTLCGGFLADKWLGAPEPDAYRETMTPSQRKYLDMIVSAWGTWALFQSLLSVLRAIGDRHGGVSIANVSTRWVLEHSFVGAVIIGARLGVSEHTNDNLQVFKFRLTQEDLASIEEVLKESNGRLLIRTIGDCGSEYR